ncbi:MAG: 2-O-methyltransferase NoeI [Bacteroidetes bacterium ADurb.Bin174]|jgi:FkbM family methyltransferase|nr:MAG: 2-O-methyltransferase NoeI [Bacteroidetes bacterium ADurb.Bin174]
MNDKMLKRIIRKLKKYLGLIQVEQDLSVSGEVVLFDRNFSFHHKGSYLDTYSEIFNKQIYKFNPRSEKPIIIDCGANMGLSLLYFSLNYPNAKIFAFEPDNTVLPFLEKNIKSFGMKNVQLFKKAVWNNNEILKLYTDGGMGGSVVNNYNENQVPIEIEAIRLLDFIGDLHVDLLKMDIEGSEYGVIKDCESKLNQIDNLFVEYHSFIDREQKLDEILLLLKNNGFRYHLSQSYSRNSPFIDKDLVCESFDMAINIFAYK